MANLHHEHNNDRAYYMHLSALQFNIYYALGSNFVGYYPIHVAQCNGSETNESERLNLPVY